MEKRKLKFDKTESVGFLLFRTGRAMRLFFARKLTELGYEIKTEHMGILVKLLEEGEMTQKGIGDYACQDKTNITRTIDFLQGLGLVSRKEDESDRRNKKIQLTSKGENLIDELGPKIMKEILPEATKNLSGEELKTLKMLLNKLYDGIEPHP